MQLKFRYLLLMLSLVGCSETEYPHKFPIVLTEEVADVSSTGARFSGRIQNLDGFKIISYGFVWDQIDDPSLTSSKLSFSNDINEGVFTELIQNDLEEGKTYFVRAFIQTDKVVVYGDSKAFNSKGCLPPAITGFSPAEGRLDTEITITGNNFSAKTGANRVTIGGIEFTVISASKNEIVVKQPMTEFSGAFAINIEVAGQSASSTGKYFIIGPVIESMSKTSGRVGDLIILSGHHFSNDEDMHVRFGEANADAFFISETQIGCYVPDAPGTSGKLKLLSYSQEQKVFDYPGEFSIVDSWQQRSAVTPMINYFGYSFAQMGNRVFVVGGQDLYEYNLSTGDWTKKQDFPGSFRFNGTSFTVNGKLYYGFGSGASAPDNGLNGQFYNDLWSYDPATNTWTSIGTTPLAERMSAVALVINSKVYIGFGGTITSSVNGLGDLWEYNAIANSWTQINTSILQGNFSHNPAAFAAGSKCYFVGLIDPGYISVVWEFNPSSGQWTRKSDLYDWVAGEPATTIDDHGLVVTSLNGPIRVYEYDPVKDEWIRRQTSHYGIAPFKFGSYYQGALHIAGAGVWELRFGE